MLPCNAGPLCQNIHVHNWWFFIGILLIRIVFSVIEFICCIVFPLCNSRPGLYFKILNSKLTSFTSNFFPDGKMTSNGFLCKLIWPCAGITQWNINVSIIVDLTTQGENLSSPPQNPHRKSEPVPHLCGPSVSTVRWEMEMEESPEAWVLVGLACTMVNKGPRFMQGS